MNKKVFPSVFEHKADAYQEAIAIRQYDRSISYGELNKLANRVANLAVDHIGCRQKVIATYFESSIAYIATIIGISKSGNIFMPLEVSYPENRLVRMIEKGRPTMYFVQEKLLGDFLTLRDQQGLEEQVIITISENYELKLLSESGQLVDLETKDANLNLEMSGDESCYLFFTSGSTGEPKGIEGVQKSLSHFIHWEMKELDQGEEVNTILLAPVSFDVSLRDIFLPLFSGGTLCLISQDDKRNIERLIQLIKDYQITVLHMVPSLLRVIIDSIRETPALQSSLSSIKFLMMAGEALYGQDVLRLRSFSNLEHITVYNLYGPSETTLAKLFYKIPNKAIQSNAIVPLGSPISNTVVMVLKDNKSCGIGQVGEICVKTPFRSRGYFGDEKATRERFVQNPEHNDFEDIIYRSGDLGKLNFAGEIEFIGRLDNQVKINGNRVEIAEVEYRLMDHPSIDQVVVVATTENKEVLLKCFYKSTDEGLTDDTLRAFLATQLPAYMIPGQYMLVDQFPLNDNGKVDRKQLLELNATQENVAATTATEISLCEMWTEVLEREVMNINESFFSLGGSSLKGIKLIARIAKQFGLVIKIGDLFENPTVAQLAKLLDQLKGADQAPKGIQPAKPQPDYVLSHQQKRLWLLEQLNEGLTAYNVLNTNILEGVLHLELFEKAMSQLVERHESLRTIFVESDGEPRQKILSLDQLELKVPLIDVSLDTDPDRTAREIMAATSEELFQLDKGPLFQVKLVKLSSKRHYVIISMHHIISDAWSIGVMLRDATALYNALVKGQRSPLKSLPFQYKDFAVHQNGSLSEQHESKEYWNALFENDVVQPELPYDKVRPAVFEYDGQIRHYSLSTEETGQLKRLAEEENVSLFIVLYSTVLVLLHRYSQLEEIVIGTPSSGRDDVSLKDQIGFYVNTLAIKNQVHGDQSIRKLIQQVAGSVSDALMHESYPFDDLVSDLSLERDFSRLPLFNAMVVYQMVDNDGQEQMEGLNVEALLMQKVQSKYEITFNFSEEEGQLFVNLEYCLALFSPERIDKIFGHFENLVRAIIQNPASLVKEASYLHANEIPAVVDSINAPGTGIPDIKTSFEAMVARQPSNLALVTIDQAINYGELNYNANKLANYLISKGIGPGKIVMTLNRDVINNITAVVGIVKTGAAYLPVDPYAPKERIRYFIENSGCEVILASEDYLYLNDDKMVLVDQILSDKGITAENPTVQVDLESAFYVIYTSGSTGMPKGAAVSQRSALNLYDWYIEALELDSSDTTLLIANISFDQTQKNIFSTLTQGATLGLTDFGKPNYLDIERMIQEHHVTLINCAPPAAYLLFETGSFDYLRSIKNLVLGGEPIQIEKLRAWLSDPSCQAKVMNTYGPTECTDTMTYHWVDIHTDYPNSVIPIGKATPNVGLYLLDAYGDPVTDGAVGEVYLGGQCLGMGYVNNEELNAQKFGSFSPQIPTQLYKTGDLMKINGEGLLEYVGRVDNQVKIRGTRVDPTEIVHLMLQYEGVKNAHVAMKQVNDDYVLVAYVVADNEFEESGLRLHLKDRLPSALHPSFIVVMDSFPVLGSGKLDLRAFPMPTMNSLPNVSAKPRNAIEKQLLSIWSDVLKHDNIALEDNFFEVGGDSLKMVKLQRQLARQIEKEISVADLFKYNSIEALGQYINKHREAREVIGIDI